MAKDRILGSSAKIEIYRNDGNLMTIEVDSITSNQKHDQKTWHPLGEIGERQQTIYKGWELDFKTGKIDDQISSFFGYIDDQLLAGKPSPRVRVTETIEHFDGTNEIWIYPDVVLSGYSSDKADSEDEIKENFKGSCTKRVKGY
jgi:hypothetical protein